MLAEVFGMTDNRQASHGDLNSLLRSLTIFWSSLSFMAVWLQGQLDYVAGELVGGSSDGNNNVWTPQFWHFTRLESETSGNWAY